MSTAIEFDHVGKQYRLGLVSTRALSHDLNRWWQTAVLKKEDPYLKIGETNDRTTTGSSEYVWALKDIDFKVEQGDVVGIIGKNGAGKSTLLKLLSKVTGPTIGTIRARGRIGALLEVGTGFHPEMTGRENIFMNGAIMGMSKQEIASKLDEIVDFSGCERYIDTPVKRYSSGMTVRLGFAVAAHLDPEILVVDEVLAVGDAEFQKKAIGKMQDVSRGEGRTVLFVSHNMASIKALCNHGILLEKGMIKMISDVNNVVDYYLSTSTLANTNKRLIERTDRRGNGDARFVSVELLPDKTSNTNISTGDPVTLSIHINATKDIRNARIMFTLYNSSEMSVLEGNSHFETDNQIWLHEGENIVDIHYPFLPLSYGTYRINLRLWDEHEKDLDWVQSAMSFEIASTDIFGTKRIPTNLSAAIILPNKWSVRTL